MPTDTTSHTLPAGAAPSDQELRGGCLPVLYVKQRRAWCGQRPVPGLCLWEDLFP